MDTSMLEFLAAPFVASLILTGIHAYLGVHVVERGVIFVDLSLAQIAALGATIALLLPISGGDPHAPVVYWISLAFTFMGAFVFAMVRPRGGGGRCAGTLFDRPTTPSRATSSIAGVMAAWSGVFPPSDFCGSSAQPSGMMMAYFICSI